MSSDESLETSNNQLDEECKNNAIIGQCFRIDKRLGSGSFGDIYVGEHIETQLRVAIKIEHANDRSASQLQNEKHCYSIIGNAAGFPQIYWFGQWENYNAMVMDLYGKSLEDVFEACENHFSLKAIIYIAMQLLERFEFLHSKRIAYRDVKPDNFLFGRPKTPTANIVHVVDFGLSKEYIDQTTNQHIPYREGKNLTGTARYMSINAHLGIEQSRRDDLEALGHMFVYFLKKGKLPWSGLKAYTLKERYKKIGEVKHSIPVEELCAGFPKEFADFLIYARGLQFEEDPNYSELKTIFANLYRKHDYHKDNTFDWDNVNE